jgi:hypothetical protein
VNIVYRRELQKAEDPESLRRESIAEFREQVRAEITKRKSRRRFLW